MFFRGLALNLIAWLDCNFILDTPTLAKHGLSVKSVAESYLGQQACGILNYKVRATLAQCLGFSGCATSDLKRQLELLFCDGILGLDATIFAADDVGEIFNFGSSAPNHHVGKRRDPIDFERM
jgi:hypothetical protein